MFWKVIVSAVLVVMLAPVGKAVAAQYPPESTTTTRPGSTTTTQPGSTTTTQPGSTTTTQPGSTTTTTQPGIAVATIKPGTKTTKVIVAGNRKKPKSGGKLARTGGDLATAVRVAVVLMVLGFLFYLSGRYRRAAGGGGSSHA